MSTTIASCAQSISAFSAAQQAELNDLGDWVVNVPSPSGTPQNTPAEVNDFLGSKINETTKAVTDLLLSTYSSTGARMGAVAKTGKNPCF